MLEVAAAAEAGEVDVSEGSDAFGELLFAVGTLRAVAERFTDAPQLGDVASYAATLEDLATEMVFPLVAFKIGFDGETNTIDTEVFDIFYVDLDQNFKDLWVLEFESQTSCN